MLAFVILLSTADANYCQRAESWLTRDLYNDEWWVHSTWSTAGLL